MKRLIVILLALICMLDYLTYAQTPYDSFAPETSRPMLGLDDLRAIEASMPSKTQTDTMLCVVVIDMQAQRLLLVDVVCGDVIAVAPLTDDMSKWLSVDPMSDKYPGMSPYAYCGWNPIMVIDPNGMDWYDPGDGNITWNDNVTSQEYMDQAGIKGLYLGKNVLVAKHGRDENLNEELNGAIFELYVESHTEGAIATIRGNTIPCDVDKYGTLQEGRYPASYQKYHDMPAILINGGGDLPTVRGNPNNKENYIDYDNKVMKPLTEHIMDEIYFHYGNNYFQGLKDSKGNPWTTGCQTGGNYKGSWDDYKEFMKYVPTTFNGFYYLRPK